MTLSERVTEETPSETEQASGDSCPPLQRRPRLSVPSRVATEVISEGPAPDAVIPTSLPLPPAPHPTPSASIEEALQAPISSTITPPISVPLPQSAQAPASTSAPSSAPVREAELSVDDYPAPGDDNIFFASGTTESTDAIRWENQGDAFVEPFTLADCCHQLQQFISLGLSGDPPMPPWELRYITRLMHQKFPNLSAEDSARLAEMDAFLEQMEMACLSARPAREYYIKSAQDAMAKLEQWKDSQKSLMADRDRLLDSKQVQMQSISSLRAKIAELQQALEQKLQSVEDIDRRVVEVETQITKIPSSAQIEISRLVAEDRVSDGLKIESDLRAMWSSQTPVMEAHIPRVSGAEGIVPSTQDSVFANLICFRMLDSITNVGVTSTDAPVAEARPAQSSHQTVEPSVTPVPMPTVSAPIPQSSDVPTDPVASRGDSPINRSRDSSATPSGDDEVFLDEIDF